MVTIIVANAVIVSIDGQVVKTNLLRTMGSLLGPETMIKRLIVRVALLDEYRVAKGGLIKPKKLVRANPDSRTTETL